MLRALCRNAILVFNIRMFMKNVFFRPWVGSQYGSDSSVFNKKILIIGDSHYTDESEIINWDEDGGHSCDFTTGVMNDYLNPKLEGKWKSTFTKFMNSLVLNSIHSERSPSELWNSVTFYNYLQIPAGATSRLTQYFDYSKEKDRNALLEVIEELSPDVIISWGSKVWDALPEDLGYGHYMVSEEFSSFYYKYPYRNREITLLGITHPSTSYKSSYWADVFSKVGVNI
jgi:hypothetical protein